MTHTVLIVAGGKGLRMGSDLPKQFLPIGGKPVLMTNPQNSSEVFNMKYILKNHFGLKARTPISLRRKVKLLNTYSFILNSMKNKIKKQISSNEGSIDLLIESILKE